MVAVAVTAVLTGCAPQPSSVASAAFYDMSDARFSLQAVAPTDVIRQYAVWEAVWFAGKKGAATISLSNPHYDPDPQVALLPNPVPSGWAVLHATAYLTAPNPDHNPPFSVAEWSGKCSSFPWFR